MSAKPFLKWAGGKRWLIGRDEFSIPAHKRYIEPFLGGGAVFFHLSPEHAVLSDVNARLIETYIVVRDQPGDLVELLHKHHAKHSSEYYYSERARAYDEPLHRAGQFIYLNRSCWNGLYRVNQKGEFNVPIGTKDWIVSANDDFWALSEILQNASLEACDFAKTISAAGDGDFLFVDPPYTVAHNMNGFVKYNDSIFSWEDQIRLRDCLLKAKTRGASIVLTNAHHPSVEELYSGLSESRPISRATVISGDTKGRKATEEALFYL